MSDEATSTGLARSCALRWCAGMHAPQAVYHLLEGRLQDLLESFGPRALSGAALDRLGIECLRRVAELEVPAEDCERARKLLAEARQ
jgi:hypothetical protein